MRQTLLSEQIGGRLVRVELGPRDGRLQVSIGVHREDGRGVWLNLDAARDLPQVAEALERALELAAG